MLHLGRNLVSLVVSRVLSGVVLFLIYTRLLQYLGPEAAGHFGLLASYLTVFSFFADIGMSQLIIKKMSEDITHVNKYLSNYFIVQFGLALGFMAIMGGFVYFADYPEHVKAALYVSSLGLLLSSLSLPFRTVVVANQKLTINAQINFFNSFINSGMMALAIALDQGVFFLAFISVAVAVFDLVLYGIIVHRKFARLSLKPDWPFILQLFKWNMPFMLLTLFGVYNRMDGLILPHFRSFTETGYYAAAYKFWDILAFFPGLLGITLYPFFARSFSKGLMNDVRQGLETYTRFMIAVALPMAVGVFVLAEPLTMEFFGKDFLPAADAMWVLVLAVAILFVYTPANSLVISQMTRVATKVTGFTFFFNITLNLILIPRFGFIAAAAVTAASELVQAVGYTYFIKKRIVDFEFFANFPKPLASTLAMAVFLYAFRDQNVWLVIAAGGVVYFASLYIMRFFRPSDWVLVSAAVNIRKPINPDDPTYP